MKMLVRHAMKPTVLTLEALLALQVVSISAPTAQEPTSEVMALMQDGSAYFLRDDFKKAIGPYQKALDLEKVKRTLNKSLWRVLVRQSGYGLWN